MKVFCPPFRHVLFFAAGTIAPLSTAFSQPSPAPANPPAASTDAAVVPFAPKAPATITLKDAFNGHFLVGAAIRPDQVNPVNGQIPKAAELLAREFNSISPENVMKMGPIHPRPGNDDSSYNFAPADQYVEFGLKNKMFVIGHNLCWHSQMPGWMSQPDAGQTELTKQVLMQRLKDHIFKVAGRYKGKVKGWDVVNEALADNPGQQGDMPSGLRRDSPFNRIVGSREYILMAFKWAHEADPAAELYYNDYNLDASDFKRANCIELIKYLKENGAHVTGVGMQGHYNFAAPTAAKIDETIGMFAALGVQVHITELDVRAIANPNAQLTAAVGGAPNPAPAGPPPAGAPGGPGARGGRGGRGGLPPIDTLKTSLTLTDAQVAAVTPLLAADAKAAEAAAAAGDFAKIAESRNATVAEIRKVLNETQQPQLTALLPPPGGGRGRGPAAPAVPLTAAQQEGLSKRYSEIFEVFLKHKAVTRVTFWGLRDTDSWRRNDKPLLFEDDYSRKPAYDGVIAALAKAGK